MTASTSGLLPPTGPEPLRARILLVCTANICRSPVMASRFVARLGPDVEVLSRGCQARTGSPICDRAAIWAREHGVGADAHRARQLEIADVKAATLILTASAWHRGVVVGLDPTAQARSFTLLQAARLASHVRDQGLAPPASDQSWRLAWLASEMDSHRSAGYRIDPSDDDVVDPHEGGQSHAAMLPLVTDSTDAICRALARLSP